MTLCIHCCKDLPSSPESIKNMGILISVYILINGVSENTFPIQKSSLVDKTIGGLPYAGFPLPY